MLSAKKVRIHGMRSDRWTTKDKITQYKGLINLFARDRKILTLDGNVARKKLSKELKSLRNEIESNRANLDNAVCGNRQLLRNTLAEHKDLQIAFQNLPSSKVIDHLHQGNFNKRKLLDRMNYQMKQKTETLVNLKLEAALIEDRIKYESLSEIPYEKEAQIITGKVQDATLKKEAALSVQHTYKAISNILKKDAIYFDAVLATLRLDGRIQSQCMMKTTELGQLATEYLDDRKQEFTELERAVKRDMKAREESLKIVREEVETLTHNIGLLIRRDDDVNIGKVIIPRTSLDINLQKDVDSITKILSFLQETTLVANFDCIYPCLTEQENQRIRLIELLRKCTAEQDNLHNKKSHAEIMCNKLTNTMNETTLEYISRREQMLAEINKEKQRLSDIKAVLEDKSELLVKIRSSLHQLAQKCVIVKPKVETAKKYLPEYAFRPFGEGTARQTFSASALVSPPPQFDSDGLNIITDLTGKLQILMSNALPPLLDIDKKEKAIKLFFYLTSDICSFIEYKEHVVEESLLAGVVFEDAQVPTYADIKAKSKEIVEVCNIDEDLIPASSKKKKK